MDPLLVLARWQEAQAQVRAYHMFPLGWDLLVISILVSLCIQQHYM